MNQGQLASAVVLGLCASAVETGSQGWPAHPIKI